MKTLLVLVILATLRTLPATAGSQAYVCADLGASEWALPIMKDGIRVPMDTVFEFGGINFTGSAVDPTDRAHAFDQTADPTCQRCTEKKKEFLREIEQREFGHTAAFLTLNPQTLVRRVPCALVKIKFILSETNRWTLSDIRYGPDVFYSLYGVLKQGSVDEGFLSQEGPFNDAARDGRIVATVYSLPKDVFDLDQDNANAVPDENEALGVGNLDCFGAESRQDVSCRAITESLLLSLRYSARADVVKVMNVAGRQFTESIHFISNYARGARLGSGDVDFYFDETDHVSKIDAYVDRANNNGPIIRFFWSAETLREGCSDFPGTTLNPCQW